MRIFFIVMASLVLVGFLSCETPQTTTPYVEEPIVECLLLVGKGIDNFTFTRTLPVGSKYDSLKAGISDANIKIWDEYGAATILVPLQEKPGVYVDWSYTIQPKTKYFMEIKFLDSIISGSTVTPDTFIVSVNSDSTFLYLEDKIEFSWSKSEGAVAYYYTITNLEPVLLQIDRRFNDENPYAERRTRFFWTLGTSTTVFPWLHNYYGRHEFRIYAIDENLYHYLQTSFQDVQQLTEPESNLQNAIGYFASGVENRRYYKLLKP